MYTKSIGILSVKLSERRHLSNCLFQSAESAKYNRMQRRWNRGGGGTLLPHISTELGVKPVPFKDLVILLAPIFLNGLQLLLYIPIVTTYYLASTIVLNLPPFLRFVLSGLDLVLSYYLPRQLHRKLLPASNSICRLDLFLYS